jgi:5-methylcytosine-specific restriction endonuclease McrA
MPRTYGVVSPLPPFLPRPKNVRGVMRIGFSIVTESDAATRARRLLTKREGRDTNRPPRPSFPLSNFRCSRRRHEHLASSFDLFPGRIYRRFFGCWLMASWSQTDAVGGQEAQRQVKPDPRPSKRLRASQSDWSDLHQGFAHACCVNCGLPYQSLHHIVPRSQGGDDYKANLAPMCGDGTRGCHGILESHAPGWERVAAAVRVYVLTNRPRCVYVIGKLGWDRFNKRYPLLSEPGASSASGSDLETAHEGSYELGSGMPQAASGSESSDEPVWRYRPPEDEPGESFAVEGHE